MIKILVKKSESFIQSISIKGHSNYDDSGKDIVCAGVSAVSIGGLNAIYEITGQKPNCTIEDGNIQAIFSNDSVVQIIAQTIITQLQSIEEQYKEFIKIKYTQ